ncbi:MAG: GNAT family N-acetyltransferase [Candidatus Thorarchaeota archaeon]|jgi:ribosomal protein S18 acetylase RimI-like enzyme
MNSDESDITAFELMAGRAWPALYIEELEGWQLRADDGITWRANCVLPVGKVEGTTLDEAIENVIEFYSSRSLPTAFKMTLDSQPKELDDELDQLGFLKYMITHVQTASVDHVLETQPAVRVEINNNPSPAWISCYGQAGKYDEHTLNVRTEIIRRISNKKAVASAFIGEELVGVGLGVLEDDWIGLFSITTLEKFRRNGVAKSVNYAIANWAKKLGADRAYLQVEADNDPALVLYKSMNFQTLYTYWYRILRKEIA